LTAAQATAAGLSSGAGSYVINGGTPTSTPALSQFTHVATVPDQNRYDFASIFELQPDYDYRTGYVEFERRLNERVTGFVRVIYEDQLTKNGFTPAVVTSTANPGTGPSGTLDIPAANPYNPFGIDLTNFSYRTNFGPARSYDTTSRTLDSLAGLRGSSSRIGAGSQGRPMRRIGRTFSLTIKSPPVCSRPRLTALPFPRLSIPSGPPKTPRW